MQQENDGLDYGKDFLTTRQKEIFTRCLLERWGTENEISSPLWSLIWSRGLNWAILLSSLQPWALTIHGREGPTSSGEELIFCRFYGCVPFPLWASSFQLQTHSSNHCAPHMRCRGAWNEDSSVFRFITGVQIPPVHLLFPALEPVSHFLSWSHSSPWVL